MYPPPVSPYIRCAGDKRKWALASRIDANSHTNSNITTDAKDKGILEMQKYFPGLKIAGVFALLLLTFNAQAQFSPPSPALPGGPTLPPIDPSLPTGEPSWSAQLVDATGNPFPALDYTFTQGSLTRHGQINIYAKVTETDPIGSGYEVAPIGVRLTSDSPIDLRPFVVGYRFNSLIFAGGSDTLILGSFSVDDFLSYVDTNYTPGNITATTTVNMDAVNGITGARLNPISIGQIRATVHILPAATPTPEPGNVALLFGLALSGAGFLLRRKPRLSF